MACTSSPKGSWPRQLRAVAGRGALREPDHDVGDALDLGGGRQPAADQLLRGRAGHAQPRRIVARQGLGGVGGAQQLRAVHQPGVARDLLQVQDVGHHLDAQFRPLRESGRARGCTTGRPPSSTVACAQTSTVFSFHCAVQAMSSAALPPHCPRSSRSGQSTMVASGISSSVSGVTAAGAWTNWTRVRAALSRPLPGQWPGAMRPRRGGAARWHRPARRWAARCRRAAEAGRQAEAVLAQQRQADQEGRRSDPSASASGERSASAVSTAGSHLALQRRPTWPAGTLRVAADRHLLGEGDQVVDPPARLVFPGHHVCAPFWQSSL